MNNDPAPAAHVVYDNVPGNHYDKYATGNPIARALMRGFFSAFDDVVAASGAKSAYEIGCGEGHLSLRMMQRGLEVNGSDLEESVVSQANDLAQKNGFGAAFSVRDMYTLTPDEVRADLIVCCEVLEHLPDPEAALSVLAALSPAHIVLSVPREPVWRVLNVMRGKYVSNLGNTPGHIQHWSKSRFVDFVSRRFDVTEVRSPFPWTMVLCKPRR
jgi:2-polyprenyl-3-methyl-5-hydroxy-6-metoxy-1,4-benzoquinol methylase